MFPVWFLRTDYFTVHIIRSWLIEVKSPTSSVVKWLEATISISKNIAYWRVGAAISTANTVPQGVATTVPLETWVDALIAEAKGHFAKSWVFSSKVHVSWEWLLYLSKACFTPLLKGVVTNSPLVPRCLHCSLKLFEVDWPPSIPWISLVPIMGKPLKSHQSLWEKQIPNLTFKNRASKQPERVLLCYWTLPVRLQIFSGHTEGIIDAV